MAAKKPKAEPELVLECGVERDDEKYLYFVDKRGNVTRMERGVPKAPTEIIVRSGVKRQKGFMYYLDERGHLVREPDSSRDG